jgi:7-cyano-7-deazaguanine synthase in queuosine biosynthesis
MNFFSLFCTLDGNIPERYSDYLSIDLSNSGDFQYTIKQYLKKLPGAISQKAIDLLYLSMFVFAADRKLQRSLGFDNWSRQINIIVPVLCKEKWDAQIPLIVDMLNFLSGDVWSIEFYEREPTDYENRIEKYFAQQRIEEKKIDTICMFSGGLDSFVGAIDILATTKNVLFISLYGGGKGAKPYQDVLIENFLSNYGIESTHFYQFYAAKINGVEDTTRTRSFMFFGHAIAVASCLQRNVTLTIPENGLISLNIPLTYSRLGSSSTRTTHPYYMSLLQRLICNLGVDATLCNPYQFKTKGEMMVECKDQQFMKANISSTMSCSHPDGERYKSKPPCHCGICLPCLVRRAAICRAGLTDSSSYKDSNFSATPTAKTLLNSYKMAVSRFRPAYSFLNIQNAGSIVSDIDQYAALYTRGMNELTVFLEKIHAI